MYFCDHDIAPFDFSFELGSQFFAVVLTTGTNFLG